jgi:hypothetical protein
MAALQNVVLNFACMCRVENPQRMLGGEQYSSTAGKRSLAGVRLLVHVSDGDDEACRCHECGREEEVGPPERGGDHAEGRRSEPDGQVEAHRHRPHH